ncbi:hypothetical protein AAE478_003940 [Parahypoxylon ruwenzoriense]
MAPLTRRQAKVVTNAPPNEEPDTLRGKRKSTGHGKSGSNNTSLNSEPEIPKRQRLTLRTKEDGDEGTTSKRQTHIEVHLPSTNTVTPKGPRTATSVPDSQGPEGGASESELEFEPYSASKQLEEEASQKLASQSAGPPEPTPKPKSKHVVFGDGDEVDNFVAVAAASEAEKKHGGTEDEDDSDSDDSDDDAPEAVSTQDVAKKMRKEAQVASETAERQAASLKRKRQDRDSLYKQQAERRKRARGAVEVHQTKAGGAASSDGVHESRNDGIIEIEKGATAGRRRAEKFNLPTVLPAEFLTDSSDESEDEAALKRVAKKPKKMTFETAAQTLIGGEGSKRPGDEVVGSTRYRVLEEQGDPNLAPKLRRDAQRPKENLLKRRRSAVTPNKKGGFFARR